MRDINTAREYLSTPHRKRYNPRYPSSRHPMKTSILPPIAASLALALLCVGCSSKSKVGESTEFFKKIFRKETYSLYRIDIQQGNAIDPAQLTRLKTGMTKDQVRYLLGNPLAENVFHKNRWHYIYYLIPGKGETKKYRLVLYFDQDRLINIQPSKMLAELMEKSRQNPRPK